jgi:hypothetical protein
MSTQASNQTRTLGGVLVTTGGIPMSERARTLGAGVARTYIDGAWHDAATDEQWQHLISTGGLGRTQAESSGRSAGGETSMDADRRNAPRAMATFSNLAIGALRLARVALDGVNPSGLVAECESSGGV